MSLEVRDLRKSFGGVQALQGVSFAVQPGECVALIGPNGAGKSTAFACIAGQHTPDAGRILWRGQPVEGMAPAQRLRAGIARTFQVAQTFEALTVLQNLQLLARGPGRQRAWDVLETQHADTARAALAQVGLQGSEQALAGDLPYGARKRLELAMALLGLPGDGSGLLLLDEPAAGLAAAERHDTMALVRRLASAGQMAVLYTEHNMDAVFGVADRVLVLMRGIIVAQGSPAAVAHDPLVQQNYLGQSGVLASEGAV